MVITKLIVQINGIISDPPSLLLKRFHNWHSTIKVVIMMTHTWCWGWLEHWCPFPQSWLLGIGKTLPILAQPDIVMIVMMIMMMKMMMISLFSVAYQIINLQVFSVLFVSNYEVCTCTHLCNWRNYGYFCQGKKITGEDTRCLNSWNLQSSLCFGYWRICCPNHWSISIHHRWCIATFTNIDWSPFVFFL